MHGKPSWRRRLLQFFGFRLFKAGTIALDHRQIKNVLYYNARYQSVVHLPGTIVECGVGMGRSLLYLANAGKGRAVWGFDSFQGFPEPAPEDSSSRTPQKGDWAGTSPKDVQQVLKAAGVPTENVHLIPGFFPDSFSAYDGSPIALLHIDVDLYQSYKDCLDFFYPFVVKGGVILFDEYNDANWPGATKAIDEFLERESLLLQNDGKYYCFKA